MPILILLGIGIIGIGISAKNVSTPKSPPIRDYEKFNRETLGMDAKEIKRGLRNGKW